MLVQTPDMWAPPGCLLLVLVYRTQWECGAQQGACNYKSVRCNYEYNYNE